MKKLLIILNIILIFTTSCENAVKPISKTEINYPVINNQSKFTSNDKIYFIMVDRFNDGDPENNIETNKNVKTTFHGGDIKGITEKLDYIKDLGFTAIWITPITDNDLSGYHGYWTVDFYKVDENFGTLEDLKKLVNEAHKKDIKVILDYVVNHTGPGTKWLTDGEHEGWFHKRKIIQDYNNKQEVEDGWLASLPDLDTENPEVREFLIENALWWIDETNLDGFRLDTVRHVPESFWNEFSYRIKEKYPDFYLIGEVWDSNVSQQEKYHQLGIDGLLNYSLYYGIQDTFRDGGFATKLVSAINNESGFENPGINGVFIDNHDNQRFYTTVRYNDYYFKQALTFMYSYPSIPIVYYGTEIPIKGGPDPDNRADMPWDKVGISTMIPFLKKLDDFRNTYMDEFNIVANDNKFIAYEVKKDENTALVIANIFNGEKDISFEYKANKLINFETNEELSHYIQDGIITFIASPAENLILIVE